MEGKEEVIEKAKSAYRARMDSFIGKSENPPTCFELNQKHAELVSELKAANPGANSLALEADLRQVFESFIAGNKVQRQMSLLRSALGNSLFEETQADLRKLASMGSVDVSE